MQLTFNHIDIYIYIYIFARPLELDTDGIWCILPASFPQDVKIQMTSGKSFNFPYPAAMLNADVHER